MLIIRTKYIPNDKTLSKIRKVVRLFILRKRYVEDARLRNQIVHDFPKSKRSND
jgi:GTP cyclohydrolase I